LLTEYDRMAAETEQNLSFLVII